MKILVVSNFYPPIHAWGYTLWCQEVSDCLKARGHHLVVLTSDYQADNAPPEEGVYRWLRLENDLNFYSTSHFFRHWKNDEQHNRQAIQTLIAQEAPSLIFIWGMYGLSRSIPAVCEELYPDRTIYFISDQWPANESFNQTYWDTQATSRLGRIAKQGLSVFAREILARENYPPTLKYKHAITVSEAVRHNLINAGLPFEHNITINGGSDTRRFLYLRPPEEEFDHQRMIRMIYAGAFGEHKGVHTVIEAMSQLTDFLEANKISLALYGSGHSDYETRISTMISKLHLDAWIHIPGRIEPENMPDLLRKYDILLFPSTYEEPLPRMVEEAMLSGLLVIGTTTGGTGELIIDGQTGLTYSAGNSSMLAEQIRFATEHPSKSTEIARRGQQHIMERFTLIKMADEIEAYLQSVDRGKMS